MINLLEKINEDNYELVAETPYVCNGHYVPRVTSILSDMLNEEYLMGWSNYLGFKRQKYKQVLEEAALKGSYTHESIENYIQNGIEPDINSMPVQCQNAVENAFQSFMLWWSIISKNEVEVIYEEKPLVCEWYGGTLDLLLKINGKIYLFDFKTSNHPSYKYFIQLSAYINILKEQYNIEVDGCGIIMLDKTQVHFDEIMIDLSDEWDKKYIDHCKETFFSLVYAYYNRLRVELEFKDVLKRVN
jgi:hypothetical protein